MHIFAKLQKANLCTENIRGLNLAAVRRTPVQEIKLSLYPELPLINVICCNEHELK
jgi:hypothetical protein